MTAWNRRLGRAAGRLYAAYCERRKKPPTRWLPETSWNDAQTLLQRVNLAQEHGWTAAAASRRSALAAELDFLARQITTLSTECRAEPRSERPSLRFLYDELSAAEAEFGGLECSATTLSVTTEPVTLDELELGPFQIRLHLDRLEMDTPYSVTALEPHPAASCAETTHPHVSGERLCPGEGRSAINAALADGRIFDFFTIVDRILHTYSQGSAFVELDRWHGVPCHDCDCTLNEDEAASCYACDERLCDDCRIPCGSCSESYCSGCIDRCERCEEHACSGCLVRCRNCRRDVCKACRDEDLCEICREELEEEHAEAEAEAAEVEPPIAATEPTV